MTFGEISVTINISDKIHRKIFPNSHGVIIEILTVTDMKSIAFPVFENMDSKDCGRMSMSVKLP